MPSTPASRPPGPRAQALGGLDLEDLDLQRELHLERPHPLGDDGGVALPVLEGAHLSRPRKAGRQPRHAPEEGPDRLAGRSDPDLALDLHGSFMGVGRSDDFVRNLESAARSEPLAVDTLSPAGTDEHRGRP
jgi:hypothetical protein